MDIYEQNNNNANVRIYPNPITDKSVLEIKNLNNQTIFINVTVMYGRNIKKIQTNKNSIQLNNFNLKLGIYFINIQYDKYKITRIIIK